MRKNPLEFVFQIIELLSGEQLTLMPVSVMQGRDADTVLKIVCESRFAFPAAIGGNGFERNGCLHQ